ncbi:Crp/Fnr family transcriptional regulator [Bacillus sp. L381]|uniref:Crp/Fnr family transcriptional regulator n=1 Tax=Bacillus TaxID=1386 RepID=UPI001BA47A45|nr:MULTISPECIES: Crp/Fnr family transcriptional regulator [Bacillus]MCR9039848.1 Crp/Fnr family transcriptional regulator [Bacillus velezensis]QUN09362.1 Crp/Fnr family transcriptional regulator [Bacillus amyloliquefaciens]QYM82436.1 Crp/Fnr family transcriptional regulator [Bacillus sp. 7D3]QZY11663.1 Crp/Fnr family transcriptional regulator [Bacillus amyloliquefaciens]WIX21485.1 Crp/Fnr family transcriptional regulator [Bacillus sp. L381]
MNQCDYLLCLKQLPMFNEVPLSIVAALLKNGTLIRGSSDQSPSFLHHSQSVYIVLKGSIRFKDSRLPERSQTVALWEKGAVFPVDEKGGLSLSPFISVNASPDILALNIPYSIFKQMMSYHPKLQMNFLAMLQQNVFCSYQLFLRYLHTSRDESAEPGS